MNHQDQIIKACEDIKGILLEKNRKYGDAALSPLQIFSTANPLEAINIRLDDKLKRKLNDPDDEDEDIELDIIGYLILKRIVKDAL